MIIDMHDLFLNIKFLSDFLRNWNIDPPKADRYATEHLSIFFN